jgi:protein-disulfide isomerase
VQDGNALELQGTPSFWINDKKLSSFAPEVLEAVFERILKESDSNASAR